MTIKDCKVADGDFRVQFKILDALVAVLHAFSLANVAYNSCVESLHLELEGANPERIIRLKNKLFPGL